MDKRSPCATIQRMYIIYALLVGLIGICGYIAWRLQSSLQDGDPRLKAEIAQKDQRIGELDGKLKKLQSEKDELSGNGKQLYDRFKNLEADYKGLMKERDDLSKRLTKFEAEAEQRQKKYEEVVAQQEASRKSWEDERVRIRREDEEREQRALEERDRMWGEHEHQVQDMLREICRKPQYAFPAFDNTSLPVDFDGSLKPDFMLEFLGQYIIFDAKVTRSQDIQTYISNAVKTTAVKVKKNPKIYSTIFLVVPTDAIREIKKLSFVEQGFTFYIVSPEALEPILASLKKITTYELADQFDPEERESIINWIAKLDLHISARNTFDIKLAEIGAELLQDASRQNSEMAKEVDQRKQKMKTPKISDSEMKRLVSSITARQEAINELTAPKAAINREQLELR